MVPKDPVRRRHTRSTHPFMAAAWMLAVGFGVAPLEAQDTDEPVYDELMRLVTQDALTVGTLFQAVADPSVDGDDPASANLSLASARLLMSGVLDGGFRYFLQTNFAASPSVLDARIGWVHDDRFGVWAGRFKTPFNQELLDYAGSIDMVNRSRVVSQLGTDRQLGVQVASRVDIATFTLGAFTGPSSTPSGDDLAGVARMALVPDIGDGHTLRTGISAAVGRDGAIGGRALGTGYNGDGTLVEVDARYERGQLLLAGEGVVASYDAASGAEGNGSGLYLTAGWRTTARTQILARWDRYTEPGADDADDNMVLGFNAWPTSASEIQVNWVAPLAGSTEPYKLVISFQVGFGGQQNLF